MSSDVVQMAMTAPHHVRASPSRQAVHGWRRLGAPSGLVTRARWLFCVSTMLTVLLTLPTALATARGVQVVLAVVGLAVLWAALIWRYRHPVSAVVMELVVPLGVGMFALSSAVPETALNFKFALIWFRAMYGSTRRSLLQCCCDLAAMAVTVPLSRLLPGAHPATAGVGLIGAFPLTMLTVVTARYLAVSLIAREQSQGRDGALASLAAGLLGETDTGRLAAHTAVAQQQICSATPGLRVLTCLLDGDTVRVSSSAGRFTSTPVCLPRSTLGLTRPAVGAGDTVASTFLVADDGALNALAGERCGWTAVALPDRADGCVLLGGPGGVSDDVQVAVRSQLNQYALAVRHSRAHHELLRQAHTDPLTGLANRAALGERLNLALSQQSHHGLSLLFLDLDGFKTVNDTLGHTAGDDLLIHVAAQLRSVTRAGDLCARVGGDEFAVVLDDMQKTDALAVADRLVRLIAAPVSLRGHVGTSE